MVADLCIPAADPWRIIPSAAVALHGALVDDVRDVDLLMSGRDARATLLRVGVQPAAGQATDLFRSAVFGAWDGPPLSVELFGDFDLAGPDGWSRVAPQTREPVAIGARTLFVPSADELTQMLTSFGRPKERARARLLLSTQPPIDHDKRRRDNRDRA
ncbi:hypothetical protein [Sphingomonas sp.]|uniref:hypothetical protein n=1 Tax=Sphingomonas sp. TaxID=28214 RepID=UPI00286BBAB3|nr:hypothetical protein [Sphingomonas sp.]